MCFMGLACVHGNDGEIILLKKAVNISPTCGRLEMETGQQRERQRGGRTHAECISTLPYLSLSQIHKHRRPFVFQLLHTNRYSQIVSQKIRNVQITEVKIQKGQSNGGQVVGR